jgi:hypothetical protein
MRKKRKAFKKEHKNSPTPNTGYAVPPIER